MYNDIVQKPVGGTLLDYSNPLSQGLVGCWVFNEGIGDKIYDLTYNGQAGQLNGGLLWVAGKCGMSLYSSGATTDYVQIDDSNLLTLSGKTEMSMAVRVRIDFETTEASGQYIIDNVDGITGGYRLFYAAAVNQFRYRLQTSAGAINCDTSGETWVSGEWHTLAATYDGSNMRIYWDGDISNTAAQTGTVNDNTEPLLFYVNFLLNTGGAYVIDYVYIYDRCLSGLEVERIYNNPFCIFSRNRRIVYDEIAGATTFPYYYREFAGRRTA